MYWINPSPSKWACGLVEPRDSGLLEEKRFFYFYLKMGKGKGRGEKDVHRDFLPLMQLLRSSIQVFRCCELAFSHLWGLTGYNNKDSGLASTEGTKFFVL